MAWQLSYLHELAERGIDLAGADRVVGTSAGALVAAVLTARRLSRINKELTVLARLPMVLGALAPSGHLKPSQVRALDLFRHAPDADPPRSGPSATPRSRPRRRRRRRWPATSDWSWRRGHGRPPCCTSPASTPTPANVSSSPVPPASAYAAPSPPAARCRACSRRNRSVTAAAWTAASAAAAPTSTCSPARERAVVLALTDGSGIVKATMTTTPGSTEAELAALEASGSRVFRRVPDKVDPKTLMDPAAVPDAIATAAARPRPTPTSSARSSPEQPHCAPRYTVFRWLSRSRGESPSPTKTCSASPPTVTGTSWWRGCCW